MKISKKNTRLHLGFSLIEVLVSLFILSLLLFWTDAMEIIALREAKAAYFFSVASQQLNEITNRLTLLRNDIDLNRERIIWNQENQEALPQGKGEIIGFFSRYTLFISWGDKNLSMCKQIQIGRSGCLKRSINVEALS